MLGVSLKLWRMDWMEEDSCFSTVDSSVFVFQDRLDEELVYVQNIIRLHPLLTRESLVCPTLFSSTGNFWAMTH